MEEKLSLVVDRWIIDYQSRIVWKSFDELGTIDPAYEALLRLQSSNTESAASRVVPIDDVALRSRLMVEFMCKLVNGHKLYSEGDEVTGGTRRIILEEALDILDRMLRDTNVQEFVTLADVARLKLSIRRQAVFACCRVENYALAAKVFVRLWTQGDCEREKDVRQHIAQVVSDKKKSDLRLTSEPYTNLLDESRNFLRKVMSSLTSPFLTKVAVSVYEKIEGPSDLMTSIVKREPGLTSDGVNQSDNTPGGNRSLKKRGGSLTPASTQRGNVGIRGRRSSGMASLAVKRSASSLAVNCETDDIGGDVSSEGNESRQVADSDKMSSGKRMK